METYRGRLLEIVEQVQPCSVRQVYYIGIGQLYDKGDPAYNSVVREIGILREDGRLPWHWIADHTRLRRVDQAFSGVVTGLRWFADHGYNLDLWHGQPRQVEVWCESDSISGVITPTANGLGVPVLAARGQASKTFVHNAALEYARDGRPVTILYVGDWDPSGLAIDNSVHERLRRYGNNEIEIDFRRIAVTPQQITDLDLITHSVNIEDKNYSRYVMKCREIGFPIDQSVEVESIPPPMLRDLLSNTIYEQVTNPTAWNDAIDEEIADKQLLNRIVDEVCR